MKKFIILIIIIGALVGAFFGIRSHFNKEKAPTNEVKPEEIVYNLVSVERLAELPGNIKAGVDKEWLVVNVFGQNYDKVKRLYNMYYFTFKDDDGNVYKNSPNSRNDAIKYGELATKATISGSVVFEVPKGSKGKLIITDEKYNELQKLNIK